MTMTMNMNMNMNVNMARLEQHHIAPSYIGPVSPKLGLRPRAHGPVICRATSLLRWLMRLGSMSPFSNEVHSSMSLNP